MKNAPGYYAPGLICALLKINGDHIPAKALIMVLDFQKKQKKVNILIKAAIFDFDGLLIDTETVWFYAFKEVLQEDYGLDLSLEQFAKVIGTHDAVLDAWIQENAKTLVDLDIMKRKARERFEEKMGSPVLRDGVQEYLDACQSLGLKIALASSSKREWIDRFTKQLEIDGFFDVINTRDNVANVKPDPELYLKTINDLAITPEEAIVFEDSLNGFTAAKTAGLKCVVVTNPVTAHLPFSGYELLLQSMAETRLEDIVKRYQADPIV